VVASLTFRVNAVTRGSFTCASIGTYRCRLRSIKPLAKCSIARSRLPRQPKRDATPVAACALFTRACETAGWLSTCFSQPNANREPRENVRAYVLEPLRRFIIIEPDISYFLSRLGASISRKP
jgi:hypothetical protein